MVGERKEEHHRKKTVLAKAHSTHMYVHLPEEEEREKSFFIAGEKGGKVDCCGEVVPTRGIFLDGGGAPCSRRGSQYSARLSLKLIWCVCVDAHKPSHAYAVHK